MVQNTYYNTTIEILKIRNNSTKIVPLSHQNYSIRINVLANDLLLKSPILVNKVHNIVQVWLILDLRVLSLH